MERTKIELKWASRDTSGVREGSHQENQEWRLQRKGLKEAIKGVCECFIPYPTQIEKS